MSNTLPGTWYHGTRFEFEAFDAVHLGKGNDQLGSGFYFTTNIDTALGYAESEETSRVLTVELAITKPLDTEFKLTRTQIEALLRGSPDFYDALTNFGDIEYEGEAIVVKETVGLYAKINFGADDILQVLNTISNDFYRGTEAKFLENVRKITGYDGLIRAAGNETHAVAWFPEQIKILEFAPVAERSLQP